ncbi:hypothetical protein D3C73_1040590 [compost metagenome]
MNHLCGPVIPVDFGVKKNIVKRIVKKMGLDLRLQRSELDDSLIRLTDVHLLNQVI